MIKLKSLSQFDKTVLLAYYNDSHRGPGMVVKNLTKGLRALGVDVLDILSSKSAAMTGVLQMCDANLLNDWYKKKEPLLMGPNLFVLPTEYPALCQMFNNFVVPSQWVKNKYESFDLMKDKDIQVWPVGIDTEEWSAHPQFYIDMKDETPDCLIYYKNRSEEDLAVVEAICRKFGLKYKILKYGSYSEDELKMVGYNAKFAILLTGTESQGVAYMQLLSINTPCYVFNNPTWKSEDGKHKFPAASVPYWDDRCGYKADNINIAHFKEFLDKVDANYFSPREYILENHTLEKSAMKYYNLLRRAYDKEPVEI